MWFFSSLPPDLQVVTASILAGLGVAALGLVVVPACVTAWMSCFVGGLSLVLIMARESVALGNMLAILFTLGVAVFGVVTVFFFAVSLARMASTDVSLLNLVLDKLIIAAFGHMTVFSQWLAEYWREPFGPSMGKVTFAGPLELLGYSQRIPGLFENVVSLLMGDTSNIYTGFRPLIQDFTIPGALAILAALGFIGGLGFRLVAAGEWSAVPLLLIAYVTILWTPITWFWIYNSLTATVFAVALMVFIIRLWRGASHGHAPQERLAGTS